MRFNTMVEGARWDEDAKVWRVALADGETLDARFLITATGFLSQPRLPEIPGITGFEARSSTPPTGTTASTRPVAESRSSAPARPRSSSSRSWPKKAAELTVYQRTPIWVVPKIDFRFSDRAKRLFRSASVDAEGYSS